MLKGPQEECLDGVSMVMFNFLFRFSEHLVDCYHGVGEDYLGDVAVTEAGDVSAFFYKTTTETLLNYPTKFTNSSTKKGF